MTGTEDSIKARSGGESVNVIVTGPKRYKEFFLAFAPAIALVALGIVLSTYDRIPKISPIGVYIGGTATLLIFLVLCKFGKTYDNLFIYKLNPATNTASEKFEISIFLLQWQLCLMVVFGVWGATGSSNASPPPEAFLKLPFADAAMYIAVLIIVGVMLCWTTTYTAKHILYPAILGSCELLDTKSLNSFFDKSKGVRWEALSSAFQATEHIREKTPFWDARYSYISELAAGHIRQQTGKAVMEAYAKIVKTLDQMNKGTEIVISSDSSYFLGGKALDVSHLFTVEQKSWTSALTDNIANDDLPIAPAKENFDVDVKELYDTRQKLIAEYHLAANAAINRAKKILGQNQDSNACLVVSRILFAQPSEPSASYDTFMEFRNATHSSRMESFILYRAARYQLHVEDWINSSNVTGNKYFIAPSDAVAKIGRELLCMGDETRYEDHKLYFDNIAKQNLEDYDYLCLDARTVYIDEEEATQEVYKCFCFCRLLLRHIMFLSHKCITPSSLIGDRHKLGKLWSDKAFDKRVI